MSAPLSVAQQAFAQAALTIFGPQFGIGGNLWTRTRSTGNGISGPMTDGAPTTITGYLLRADRGRLAGAAPGVRVIDLGWVYAGALGQDVQTGDILTSQAESILSFTLTGKVTIAGYLMYLADQVRTPSGAVVADFILDADGATVVDADGQEVVNV